MPELKLSYFDLAGRAEAIRKTFRMAGVPFTDDRFQPAEHAQRKASEPYGKVPVLTVDGEVIAETQSILRYAARLGGLYPPTSDPLACLMVDEILDTFDDFFERLMMPSFVERDAEKKKAMRLELMDGPLPTALQLIENRLQQLSQYEFFVKNDSSVYVHEIVVSDYVAFFRSGMVDHVPTTHIDNYKTTVATHDKVTSLPSVKQSQATPAALPTAAVSPKKLKLTYFDMPGRAEQTRLAFHIGGVAFEDDRISFDEFAQRKHAFPNAQVPVLEVDGHVCAQSSAILRFAGTLTGLYPANDPLQAAKVDEILSHIGELYFALDESFLEQHPAKKQTLREHLAKGPIPQSLESLDKRLAHWKTPPHKADSPFAMGGETMTIADLVIYALVQFFTSGFLDHVPTTIVDPYKHILQANEAVEKHPRVQDWYAAHTDATA